jgi:hypothetical protein
MNDEIIMTIIGSKYPLIYLTEHGLSLEWEISGWDISLRTIDGKQGEFHALNTDTDETVEKTLNLHDKEDWMFLDNFLLNKIESLGTLKNIPSSFITKDGIKIKVNKI